MDSIHFSASKQKCANGVNFGVVWIKPLRISSDRLHMSQFSIGIRATRQGGHKENYRRTR